MEELRRAVELMREQHQVHHMNQNESIRMHRRERGEMAQIEGDDVEAIVGCIESLQMDHHR